MTLFGSKVFGYVSSSAEVIVDTVALHLSPRKRLRYTEEVAMWRWGQR